MNKINEQYVNLQDENQQVKIQAAVDFQAKEQHYCDLIVKLSDKVEDHFENLKKLETVIDARNERDARAAAGPSDEEVAKKDQEIKTLNETLDRERNENNAEIDELTKELEELKGMLEEKFGSSTKQE